MKRLLMIGAFVILGVLGSGGTALAQADQSSDRACVGAFVTGMVETLPPGGFGAQVRDWATEVYHPFGQTVSTFATTCVLPG